MFRVSVLAAILLVVSAYSDPKLVQIRKLGFDQDHRAMSHEIVVPWIRPFKPGYCESWEWHTDERYRERRVQICRNLSGQKKHDCDSQSGYCRDRCPFTNGSFPFWRVRNTDSVPYLWTIKTAQFFDSANSRTPLTNDPTKGYASSFFGPGYYTSNAFDNNADSIWAPNGISTPGLNWIAYEFPHPIKINSIRLQGEADHPDRTPKRLTVEASCERFFKTYSPQWVIENREQSVDKRFTRPRQTGGRW